MYTPHTHARVEYVLHTWLREWLHVPIRVVHDQGTYLKEHIGARINYGPKPLLDGELYWPSQTAWMELDPTLASTKTFTAVFPENLLPPANDQPVTFDVVALFFFLLSRWEEYNGKLDQHGRTVCSEHVLVQRQLAEMPILDHWTKWLAERLRDQFGLRIREAALAYHFEPTYDLDIAWAFGHRPWWRVAAAALRMLGTANGALLKAMVQTLRGQRPDPYQTFVFLENLHREYGLRPRCFAMTGDYGPKDKNMDHRHLPYRQLIVELKESYYLGLHPSYRSHQSETRLRREHERLEAIVSEPVVTSRQHYLKMKLPQTYQRLLTLDIHHDYTMGYADRIGFRAGTARSFQWYDLTRECTTELWIHPFQVMDVILKRSTEQTNTATMLAETKALIEAVRKTGGTFRSIWHNSSFSPLHGWSGWQDIYTEIVRYAVR